MRIPRVTVTDFSEIKVPGDLIPAHEMHMTLAFIGKGTPINIVLRAIAACYSTAEKFAPIELAAGLVMSFSPDPEGRTPVIARIITPEIFTFREALVKQLEANGVEYSKRHPVYKPHVTLSYAQESVRLQVIRPIRWRAEWITVWGGDEEDTIISSEIQLRG